ncbi:MAG: arginine deiminase family protein [Alphaproteobacteria bacterium]
MPLISEEEYRYNQLIKTFASVPEPAFETDAEQEASWGGRWGCRTDVGRLRAVLVHRPGPEVNVVDPAKALPGIGAFGDPATGWYWRGTTPPDLPAMQDAHDRLVECLRAEQVRVEEVGEAAPGRMKACYTRDVVIGVGGGAIVCRMGARVRRGEELPATRALARLGVPILRTIHGTGIVEGGSFAWIAERTAVIGISARVNEEGARQVEEVLRVQGVELIRVHLTGYRLHIDGVFLMLDIETALINPTLLPFSFLETLKAKGIKTIEVDPEDHAFTVNGLAVRPGRVIMSETSRRTLDRLDRAGIEVVPLPFEPMVRGGGGIHCSTAPLARDPVS